MPFTISHAVLAPPLARLSGNRLPVAALAIGCMTPDLYRLFTTDDVHLTHQWSGLIIPNLLIAAGFCLLWYGLYRTAIFRFLGLHQPLNLTSLNQIAGFILSTLLASLIGIATHLLWDGLTHSDFRTIAFADLLDRHISLWGQPYPVHRILQIASSVIALPFLAWMCVHYYQQHKQPQPVPSGIRIYALSLFSIAFFSGCLCYLHFSQQIQHDPRLNDLYWYIGKSVNQFARGWLLSFSLGCMIFWIMDHKQRLNQA
ncbi:DUF4184 family protein [Acinetobacter sp. WZC-1]|uniref:DUF4184 family protein n=1 Tax=Acinetobacter sp. WZC-1 TaxID=3459034 RepID=UPI00403DEF1C